MEKSMRKKWEDGDISATEYRDSIAIKFGFKNSAERRREYQRIHQTNYNHRIGKSKPFNENKECSSYLGVHIAEKLLSNIFVKVTRMPYGNPGFDFICGKGFKIDVKSACLTKDNRGFEKWHFNLRNNVITNYFLLLAFDNRDDLNPIHIWLIKNDNIKSGIAIYNSPISLKKWEIYEQKNKIKKLIKCCNIKKEDKQIMEMF